MKKKQRIFYKKALIIFFAFLLVILIRGVWGGYESLQLAQEQQERQQDKFDGLDSRINHLESRISYLDTQEGLEQELLETFPVKRPGEEVFILVEQEEESAGFFEIQDEEKSWWKFW